MKPCIFTKDSLTTLSLSCTGRNIIIHYFHCFNPDLIYPELWDLITLIFQNPSRPCLNSLGLVSRHRYCYVDYNDINLITVSSAVPELLIIFNIFVFFKYLRNGLWYNIGSFYIFVLNMMRYHDFIMRSISNQ